jgi:hypothetical protein
LFDKANALGDASDAEYERKMGGKIGGSRKADEKGKKSHESAEKRNDG